MAPKRSTSRTSSTPLATSSSELTGASAGQSPAPTPLPDPEEALNLEKFQASKDAQKLVAWVKGEHERSAQARSSKVEQWRVNLMFFFGNQWVERTRTDIQGLRDTYTTPKKPYYKDRRTINRTRSFVRAEHSKFLSSIPQAVAVPATAEDQDVRAAYAAEQAWVSISERRKLRQHYTKASWWAITTGNGFLKTWWDPNCLYDPQDPANRGDITYGAITPFNLFIPDLREQDIEDQPYVITAYKKPVSWARHYYGEQLKGVTLQATSASANSILEEGVLNLQAGNNVLDSVTVYEAWVKPGAHELLPEGGIIIVVEETLVGIYREGLPYNHNQYPFTKFEHIPTATFYADSPLMDTNALQREYNDWRSRLGDYVKRMSAPQYAAAKGSVVAQKMTNEPGLVIEYKPGMPPPQPMPIPPIPQYVMDQQGVILQDWEDITGQHEVSRGTAPPGVTAGTAINYLQEKDDQFLTPQYQSIEDGYEKIAGQTLTLFNQYVDMPRKIKTIGADGAFDTMILNGADISSGLDVRIRRGSAVGQSQAAQEAKIMDMWSIGLIQDPNLALRLLEIGGTQKVLDTMNVAEAKAMRENTKMKMLTPDLIAEHDALWEQALAEAMPEMAMQPGEEVPDGGIDGPPELPPAPPVIAVDDFDVHEVHIDVHNKFRMGQEYEMLSDEIKEQFEKHVAIHTQKVQQAQMMKFLQMIPSDGTDGGPLDGGDPSMEVPIGGGEAPPEDAAPEVGGATMSANGAVPAPNLQTEGMS